MTSLEANIDGLVGPTHNYAGLSFGNVASEKHAFSVSNPRAAALQGLHKMKFLHDLGIPQMVMPPRPQPHKAALKSLGYATLADAPQELVHQVMSASAMWVANAATVSPSADTSDGRVHFTPANLIAKFHRSIEPPTTAYYLRQLFPDERFAHHSPLPAQATFCDEGAANHMRLCDSHGEKGVEIFVYGGASKKYPARQSRQACEAIARLHMLDPERAIMLEQTAQAIDAGIFHNDVIAMSNERLFIYHESAYTRMDERLAVFRPVVITQKELPLEIAVATYFFNSQLVTVPSGDMAIIAPSECAENAKTKACFERFQNEGLVKHIHYLDVRESMKNGGGPACLRLRVVLTSAERESAHQHAWLNDDLYQLLCQWIEINYRDRILIDDLRDPMLANESEHALAELSRILKLNIAQ